MDRLVQEAIKMVLVAIWEPDFEKMNRSFGFRPNKSCHDAVTALQSNYTIGLTRALEGDISGAYDNVRKSDVIKCLEMKIKDRKFIKFMNSRLDYDYVDTTNKTRVKPEMGGAVPQGGIDSPYLFNIVFHELDKFVMSNLQLYLNKLNSNLIKERKLTPGGRQTVNKNRRNIKEKMLRTQNKVIQLRRDFEMNKDLIFPMEKQIKNMKLYVLKQPYYDHRTKRYRLFYVRYADDWILLSNASIPVVSKMKQLIKAGRFYLKT